MKLYMFRLVPPYIIMSFSLYTQPWYMSYRFADSLLCVQWKTHDDGHRNCLKHVVSFQEQIWEISASSWFYYKKSNIFLSGLLKITVVSSCRQIIPCCSLIQHSRINAFMSWSAKTNKNKTLITCKNNRTLLLIQYLCYGLIILVIGNWSRALSFTNLIFWYPTRLLFLQNG